MIKNEIKKTTGLLSVSMLFTHMLFAQPVIKVPPGCYVVVAGTGPGVATGLGGNVGSGGIVCMPDPFDIASNAGNFTEITGITINSWQLSGDISAQTSNIPPAAAMQSAGTVSVLNIESYNKNLRPSESLFPSVPTLARSKGKVRIYYKGTCENYMEFEILKQYKSGSSGTDYVPPIIGSTCLLPNTSYTFSVDAVASDNYADNIGGDRYYWTLPYGIPLSSATYTSADKSSVAFTTPPVLSGSSIISCCYGRGNPWDADATTPTTCVTKTVAASPLTPALTSTTCIPTGTVNITLTASTPVKWKGSGQWSFSTPFPGISATNTLSFNNDNNPGTVILTTPGGACPDRVDLYDLTRNFVNPPLGILPHLACVPAGSTGNTFQISPNAISNAVIWTLGGFSASATGTSSTTLPLTATGTAGKYVITAKQPTCPGTIVDTMYVKPANSGTISGPSCINRGSTASLAYMCSVAASYFSWTTPWGNFITTTNTLNVTPNGTTAGNITVQAGSLATCLAPVSAAFMVKFNPQTPTGITPPACMPAPFAGSAFIGSAFTATGITAGPNDYLVWSSTAGFASPSGGVVQGSVSTTFTFNTLCIASGTYTISVKDSVPGCGVSSTVSVNVTVNNQGMSIDKNTTQPTFDVFTAINLPVTCSSPNYQWYRNGVAMPGQTSSVLVTTGTSGATSAITCIVSNCGCPIQLCTTTTRPNPLVPIIKNQNTRKANIINDVGDDKNIILSPNPNQGSFKLNIGHAFIKVTLHIISSSGSIVGKYLISSSENTFNIPHLANGSYTLVIDADGIISTKSMIIHKN